MTDSAFYSVHTVCMGWNPFKKKSWQRAGKDIKKGFEDAGKEMKKGADYVKDGIEDGVDEVERNAKYLGRKAEREVEFLTERAEKNLEKVLEKGGRVIDRLQDVIQYLAMSPEEILRKIKEEVVDEVEDAFTSKLPSLIEDEIVKKLPIDELKELPNKVEDLADKAADEAERVAKDVLDEVKDAFDISNKVKEASTDVLFSVAKPLVRNMKDISGSMPFSDFSLKVDIAGTSVSFSWEGAEQVEQVFEKLDKIIEDNAITGRELAEFLLVALPSSATIEPGASVTIALVGGSSMSVSGSLSIQKDKMEEFVKKIPDLCDKVFVKTPREVLSAGAEAIARNVSL